MKQNISLQYTVNQSDIDLLKHGICCYKWIRSKHYDRYYLYPCKSIYIYTRIIVILLSLLLFTFLISSLIFNKTDYLLFSVGVAIIFATFLFAIKYIKQTTNRVKKIPPFAIAWIDIKKEQFSVIKHAKTPFIQIKQERLLFSICEIDHFEKYSAYEIHNCDQSVISDIIGYLPSWSSLYLITKNNEKILVFTGGKIPFFILSFIEEKLNKKLYEKYNFSRY